MNAEHIAASAWGDMLSRYQWDAFVTLTYSSPCRTTEKVLRDFNRFIFKWQSQASQTIRTGRWFERIIQEKKSQTVTVLGIEQHKTGTYHAHALVKFDTRLGEVSRELGWSIWHQEMKLGLTRIEKPRSQAGVSMYTAKYVCKGGEVHLSRSFKAPAGLEEWIRPTSMGSPGTTHTGPGATILDAPGPLGLGGAVP